MRLLVIEDEPMIGASIQEMLEEEGWSATHVTGTQDALQAVADRPYDLALVDVRLAFGDSGIVACQMLLDSFNIPSVLTTGWHQLPDHVGSFALAVLHKPFDRRQLADAIRTVDALLKGETVTAVPARLALLSSGATPAQLASL